MKFSRTFEVNICGVDMEWTLEIHGTYQPREPATLEYPGCDEEFRVANYFIHANGLHLGGQAMKLLTESILEEVGNNRGGRYEN